MSADPRDLLDRAVAQAVALDLEQVPETVRAHAGRVVADTVGVICAGAREPEMVRLVAALRTERLVAGDGTGASHVLAGGTAPPPVAAFLNGTAGTFLELDEGMRPTGHPAMHVVPAAIAVAEPAHATGADLLRSILAGYEVAARLFRAYRLTYPAHPHGHFGAVGGAVAVALLTGVDPVQAARIAATTPLLGVWDACFDGATARNTFTGIAARSAVEAGLLAGAGFTGSAGSLPAGYGTLAGTLVDPDAMTAELDPRTLAVGADYLKQHSACALSHTALDAVLSLRIDDPETVEHVLVETVGNSMKLDRMPGPSDLSGRFSLPYAVATGLALGRTDPEAFRYRPDLARLAGRVEVVEVDEFDRAWPEATPARVTVRTAEGSRTATVDNPHGHASDPLTPAEVEAKFTALVGDAGRADRWWAQLTRLETVPDCATILATGAAG